MKNTSLDVLVMSRRYRLLTASFLFLTPSFFFVFCFFFKSDDSRKISGTENTTLPAKTEDVKRKEPELLFNGAGLAAAHRCLAQTLVCHC